MDSSINPPKNINAQLISYVSFTFIGYFIIGLSLSVLPIFISKSLGYSLLVAGIVISLQYISTFFLRAYSGKVIDGKGPKPAVLFSMIGFSLTGIFLILAYYFKFSPILSLAFLVITRLLTGCAEGMVGASPINWAIMALGEKHTAKIISYNGVACYGALAIGASLGIVIEQKFGLYGIGILSIVLGIIGFFYAKTKENKTNTNPQENQSFWKVLGKVAPFGVCLALGGIGFASISTFITLYYNYFHWNNGALCLSIFGGLFVAGRLIFSNVINNYGGIKVAIACLFVETIGLLIIAFATNAQMALVGAGVTGLGFSLIFPALGVMAIKSVSPSSQGSALAGYGLFIDISLGVAGPIIGSVADFFGMQFIFPFSAAMVFIGLGLAYFLKKKSNLKKLSEA
ncbi:Tetracycline resistance protein, class B [Chryseobacterium sp. MOF25P]|uniref:MFS transporter n=1 Tax=unclassified Chryseobacterium TaxID=2593645 RepID=UPI000805462D|nr:MULTISPECIES: MFS transporter [unclassified Chryseobacterium]OBW42709.1 Tetracycline resistance protein, class B [Chryseobacterium sp. MOF25P]OBW46394.1 Tetracycline resistance protein, class B [Chryseobacterium sp. BGARF1]